MTDETGSQGGLTAPRFQKSVGALFAATFLPLTPLHAGFGVITGESHHTMDSGAGLVIRVLKNNGGIDSVVFNGKELHTRDRSRHSSINSGLGGATTTVRADAETIVITVATDADNGVVKNLTHYYVFRKGDNTLYMATHAQHEPGNGELRWITRLDGSLFTKAPVESDLRVCNRAIESRDVSGCADGTTRSKYYGNQHAMDLSIRGVSGPGRGVFMVYGNRESSAGGPFFRDIQNQTGSNAEVYNYMNSGHNQTERLRLGVLYGPYALCFTDGQAPAIPDMRFMATLGLRGWVPVQERGSLVVDGIKGMDPRFEYTVGLANTEAQVWTKAAASTGQATRRGIKPGKYTLTVYKGELAVHTESVTITAGQTSTLPGIIIGGDPSAMRVLWRIGEWDGTPLEFRNGRNITRMHPSDKRQSNWRAEPFLIGRSRPEDFPSCQWRDVNDGQQVKFQLGESQIAERTIRIGITAAFAGARPVIQMNSWRARLIPASDQPDSRSITIGTYRGNNATFTFKVPASAFTRGVNTLRISVISGQTGERFLSPGYAIDCVDCY